MVTQNGAGCALGLSINKLSAAEGKKIFSPAQILRENQAICAGTDRRAAPFAGAGNVSPV
jgi:hypothetical protein